MDQELALEIMRAGKSVLLTGPAGSGKTHVLKKYIHHAKADGKHVAITATTGLAATHLGGNTIHSWSGIGIFDQLPKDFFKHLKKGRRETIEKTDVLIIDEISMLHDFRLDMVDEVARKVRGNESPFGGLQVILSGDFFQLPPVVRGGATAEFAVNAQVWDQLDPVICYLSEQHRQNDDEFLEILNAMRANDLRRRHAEALLARRHADNPLGEVTELHTTNVDVDAINSRRLAALKSKPYYYHMETTGSANYIETLKKACLASEELVLKEGALVMFIRNDAQRRYANGSLGTVVGFDKDTGQPIVELKSGRRINVEPEAWELRDGDKKRAGLSQLPLRLAWAITVHKSQGMTLDAARVDLSRAFVEGMGYVALSRVRSLDTLSLAGINQMALKISPKALEIESLLREKSTQHAKQYDYLRAAARKRQTDKPATNKKTTWAEKLAAMRQTYPNAYRPWSQSDDEKLARLFKPGKDVKIKDLTEKFGRHPGSIRARLKKLFGEDAVI